MDGEESIWFAFVYGRKYGKYDETSSAKEARNRYDSLRKTSRLIVDVGLKYELSGYLVMTTVTCQIGL